LQYSNLEFKIIEQQKEYALQIDALKDELSILKMSKTTPKDDLPVNLNESIIMDLKSELDIKNVNGLIYKLICKNYFEIC
jgi:hypothetical protein